jgi:hypothetical protein
LSSVFKEYRVNFETLTTIAYNTGKETIMKKKRIFMSVIGNQDPYNKSGNNGPIINALRIFKEKEGIYFDKIFLFYSYDKSKNNDLLGHDGRIDNLKKEIMEIYTKEKKNDFIKEIDLLFSTPFDLLDCIKALGDSINEIIKGNISTNFFILTNPGTPQLTSSWLTFGNEKRIPNSQYYQLREFIEAKDNTIQYETNDIRKLGNLELIEFSFLFENEIIETGFSSIIRYDFNGAKQVFRKLVNDSYNSRRRKAASEIIKLCEGLQYWKNRDYANSLRLINSVNLSFLNEKTDMINTLNAISNNVEIVTNDIICIAEASYIQGNYIESLAQCVTAYEFMISKHAELLGIELYENNDFSRNIRDLQLDIVHQEQNPATIKRYVNINTYNHNGLSEVDKYIRYVNRIRNQALHDAKSISETDSKRAIDIMINIFNLFYQDLHVMHSNHPIYFKKIEELSLKIKREFIKL